MKALMPWRAAGSNLFDRMRDEMDDMFRRTFGPVAEVNGDKFTWAPSVDVEETDKEIFVKADLPGVDPKDIDITIRDGVLFLRGEKKFEKEEKEKNYHRIERFGGTFYRSIPLPVGANESNVTATTCKGVVTIAIPKKPEVQPKKVTVQAKD
jgi:HSP20 family protein